MKWTILVLLIFIGLSFSSAQHEVLILILSQPDTYHNALAKNLLHDIHKQLFHLNNTSTNVKLLHEIIDYAGYWTFLPVLPILESLGYFPTSLKWVILCEDKSSINVTNLLYALRQFDFTQDFYTGYPLYDKEATIIHHFAFFEQPQWFPYPLIRAGVAFSRPLIAKLAKCVQDGRPTSEFFIDASHELSLFIWRNIKMKKMENNKLKSRSNLSSPKLQSCQQMENICEHDDGTAADTESPEKYNVNTVASRQRSCRNLLMASSSYFCRIEGPHCGVYASQSRSGCKGVQIEEIYFAIKTCHKFHNERIPIIEKTWGQHTVHKKYFSDVSDNLIPTFATNVPNTESGHCAKTLSIIKLALEDIKTINAAIPSGRGYKPIKWIILTDDDTMLSVSRVSGVLGCFNATQHIYLGERYGYRLHSKDGFNYITGGGGMAISLPTARTIVSSCVCPTISSPDDMIIGMCLQRLGIKAVHSPAFHQARPSDYPAELLSVGDPVSFHKFWQINPVKVYANWFRQDDEQILPATVKKTDSICDIKTSQSTNFVKQTAIEEINQKPIRHSDL